MELINMLLVYKDMVVLDIETTGLEPTKDEIIEVSILKTVNGKIVDRFSSLVKPKEPIPKDITEITHITNGMVENAPEFSEIADDIKAFIGNSYILGHNVNFDLSFLSQAFNEKIPNPYLDTLTISRKLLWELEHHTLKDIAEALEVDYSGAHRSERDCEITLECFERLKVMAIGIYVKFGYSKKPIAKKKSGNSFYGKKVDTNSIVRNENSVIQTDNFLYNKVCVFSGDLKISRKEAMQKVVDLGGYIANGVTKKTNVLILGDDHNLSTSKAIKAKQYQEAGIDIQIISADTFYKNVGI